MLIHIFQRRIHAFLVIAILLAVASPTTPTLTLAAPSESGVYTEDFSTYANNDYVQNAQWDIWSHVLRVARADSVGHFEPVIAAASTNDNVYIVWNDRRNGSSDIYAQHIDSRGNRLWPYDVRVNSDSGLAEQTEPSAIVDNDGNVVIAWEDDRTSAFDIYAQKINANGNKLWASDVRVNAIDGSAWYGVRLTWNPVGNAIAVWEDWRNGNSDIYAQKIGSNGERSWASDIRVVSDTGTSRQERPDVTADNTGNIVVVWHDQRNGNYDIFAQKLTNNGVKQWPVDIRVDSDNGSSDQKYPRIAADSSGNTVAVWEDYRSDSRRDIYAQRLNANGVKTWATDTRVNSDEGSTYQNDPAVVVDRTGKSIIAWTDWRTGLEIRLQQLNSTGAKLWPNDIYASEETGSQSNPSIGSTINGEIVIIWNDTKSFGWPTYGVYGQKFSWDGIRQWTIDTQITRGNGVASQEAPKVAIDESGNAFVVWSDNRSDLYQIYIQKYNTNGYKMWAADVQVDPTLGQTGANNAAIVADQGGNIVVAWSDQRHGNRDVFIQKFDTNGNKLWPSDVCVNSDTTTTSQTAPSLALDNANNILISWLDTRNGNTDIYAQKIGFNGSKLWLTDARVNSNLGSVDGWIPPSIAADINGNSMVIWTDNRNSNADIFGQRLDGAGNRLWSVDTRINSDSGFEDQCYGSISMDMNGEAIIAWHDFRDSSIKPNIYAQKVNFSGVKQWTSDVLVNSNIGFENHYFPQVLVNNGNATIVWYGRWSGDYDIYAQKLNSNGIKLWSSPVRVNSDNGIVDQDMPSTALDGLGNVLVVWEDYRFGNYDIYGQKISANGAKVWTSDQWLVYPDSFYHSTSLAQSRTVDTVAGDIRQATLTTNYQLNGGNIEFALSNNGGANWVTATLGTATVFTTTGSDLRWRAVLTGDPLWRNRSPIVTSLRIEYSTAVPYADDYEADDDCAHAKPIATGGAAQTHTFHQSADADWTWFNVVSGTTYILQTTNVGPQAQTRLELHPTCAAPPTGSSISLGNGVTLNFTANQTGPIFVKVFNQSPSVFGANTTYQLSARVVQPTALAVIIAGHDDIFSAQANIIWAADRAYNLFRRAGLGKANIRFLDPNPNRDVDGNGFNDDIVGLPTLDNVRTAIQDWPRERGLALGVPLYIYLVDHGLIDHFKANGDAPTTQVSATDLNLWLSNLEATTGADNINVIIDACYSGSFIDVTSTGLASISGHNRVVIASTTSNWNAYGPFNGEGLNFSNAFFTALENQQSLLASFEAGQEAAAALVTEQQAWLDDNGDQLFTTTDGALATSRALRRVTLSGQPPRITNLSMTTSDLLQAQVVDDSAWVGVTVEVFAPDYVPPAPDGSGTTRLINVPVATLTDPNADGLFTATYPFTQTGWYRLIAHAEDTEGNLALPVAAHVCVNCSFTYLPLVRK